MNFADKKVLLVVCTLGGVLSACVKRVDIKVPKQESEIVVNCLFNPDSMWKVNIRMGQVLPGKDSFPPINNATVRIKSEDTQFTLKNIGKGEYTFSDERSKPGVSYRIEVQVPGHKLIYAVSRIPKKGTIASSKFDTVTTYFTPDNALNNVPVNRVELKLQSPSDTCYYEILGNKYVVMDYTEYIINDAVLEKLRQYRFPDYYDMDKLPEDYLQHLAQLKGMKIVGRDSLYKLIEKYTHTTYWENLVFNFCETIRHSPPVYDPNHFWIVRLYSKGGKFYNITGDSQGVFGQITSSGSPDIHEIRLFLGEVYYTPGFRDEFNENKVSEAWVSLYSLSREMYRYQISYLNQIINKQNPFAQPVQVYSNIHNGVGIFAGYQMERVRIY
jgi:hypothetical protein